MKKTLILLGFLLFLSTCLYAQVGGSVREWKGGSAPSGACPSGAPPVVFNGVPYYCNVNWTIGAVTGAAVYSTVALANDGTTDVRAALNTLVNTTMQPAGGKLIITPGIFRVASTITWPANVDIDYQSTGYIKFDDALVISFGGAVPTIPLQYFLNVGPGHARIDFAGSYKNGWVLPEWFGGNPAANNSGGYIANYQALQAAEWAAYGINRTNASGDAKYNRAIFLHGNYRIDGTLQWYHVLGGRMESLSKLHGGITQMGANKPIIDGESIAYYTFSNLTFSAEATQTSNALVGLNFSGAQGEDLRPQNISFYDVDFVGNSQAFMGVWIAKSGGGSQGDNIRFQHCYGRGFTYNTVTLGGNGLAPLTGSSYATNAIMVKWDGGDLQNNCQYYALASFGGSWIVKDVTVENQCVGNGGVPTQAKADFHFEGENTTNKLEKIRSESPRLLEGNADIDDVTLSNFWVTSWYDSNSQGSLANTQAFVGQLFSGSLAGGNGRAYKVTRADSSVSGFIFMTSLPGAFTIADSTASYTVNEHVGKVLQVKYASNGFEQSVGTITSNTATTITYTGAVDTTNFTAPASTKYQIVHSSPFWDGLPKTVATSGSGTGAGATITVSGASWPVNGFTGLICSIVRGAPGLTQYGKIASNTANTITLDGSGWQTDYPYNYLHPYYGIVAAAAGSEFVVEPDLRGGQTTMGSDIEWEPFEYAVVDGSTPGTNYHQGYIRNLSVGMGGLVKTRSTDIDGLQVSRADWGSQGNLFNDGLVEFYWRNIRVIRERGYQRPLPWVPVRNGSTSPLGPAQVARVRTVGSDWFVWNRGNFGGGVVWPDLGIGPGDDANGNSSTGKGVLAFAGDYWGKRSARGTNQAGAATNIAGGYPTGSGLGGDIGFYTSPTGASGDAVRVGSLRWKIDGATGNLLAGTDGAWSIGANGANRPLDIFTAGKISIGSTGTATATAGAATSHVQIGTVTSESLTTAAGASYTLTLTNSLVSASSRIFVSFSNGTNTQGTLALGEVTPGSGSCTIVIRNIHASQSLNGTIKVTFFVL